MTSSAICDNFMLGGQEEKGRILLLGDLEAPLTAERLVGRTARVELEIGAGRGDFVTSYASANPNTLIIAVERKLVYLRRGASKVKAAALENVVLISADAKYLLENYFAPSSLAAIHMYFPDPWPKRKHVKRRLFTPETVALFQKTLKPGGHLHLRTDVENYFGHMEAVLSEFSSFSRIDVPCEIAMHVTGFESRFMRYEKPICRGSWVLGSSAGAV